MEIGILAFIRLLKIKARLLYPIFPTARAHTTKRIKMASNQAPAEVSKVPPKPTLTPFEGKVIAVTGASRGTGLALTRYLIERGGTVSMCSATAKNLLAAKEEILRDFPEAKDRVMTTVVDIGKLDMVEAWIKATVERFGPLDGAANVAGVEQSRISPITMLEPECFSEILHANVTGTFYCLREEMKNMRDGGSIVNVGSVSSTYGSPGLSAYGTAKHALMGLTKAAAFEGAPRRIRVNALNPGFIDTDMLNMPYEMPNGQQIRFGNQDMALIPGASQPWEIAAGIAFLLGNESRFVTKAQWGIDGGWLEKSYQ
ncbi:3-oxoacyl-[acyl-carrier-protein] reductase [Magnaporthiopsis poae ATCC 64411]|uniref:3-oxoacyl-[acyl-carrier-protein] reductase n=1 Tax=Magnaporthiopsis poae (strain ATCC 64411 / 73-15) TaxID=644358 RepID=A0A0C4DN36_MAGP6|nr:3-oxoacyl-[acyl-carrier-protein] reductase [Magnaporthiopsis poae ATCC 64411]